MAVNPVPDANQEETKRVLTQVEQIEQLKEDACDVIDELAPTFYAAVGKTLGTAKSSIKIAIAYNPGSVNSDSRIDVSGALTIPGSTVARQVAVLRKGETGPAQIDMFED